MELSFNDLSSHLSDANIQANDIQNLPTGIKAIGSDYISLSDDELERNGLTCYAYGAQGETVDLIEIALAKYCSDYEVQAVRNFKLIVSKIVKIITKHEITALDLVDDFKIILGDFLLLVSNKPEIEPKTVRVFITNKENVEFSLKLRNKALYSALPV